MFPAKQNGVDKFDTTVSGGCGCQDFVFTFLLSRRMRSPHEETFFVCAANGFLLLSGW